MMYVCPRELRDRFDVSEDEKLAARMDVIMWLKNLNLEKGDLVQIPHADTGELEVWEFNGTGMSESVVRN